MEPNKDKISIYIFYDKLLYQCVLLLILYTFDHR